jgi:hypothetical protein
MKHIHEGNKVLCPICNKDFTHPRNLKSHIIKEHEQDDLLEKNINPELVLGHPLKKQKSYYQKTSLEDILDE